MEILSKLPQKFFTKNSTTLSILLYFSLLKCHRTQQVNSNELTRANHPGDPKFDPNIEWFINLKINFQTPNYLKLIVQILFF